MSQSIDQKIVRAAIHPAIGVARVGNSPNDYYIGPQVTHPKPAAPGAYRDATGSLKREAAEFRVYGYNSAGEVVRELTSENSKITWTVHVANKKAAWYQFQIALDIPEASSADPSALRNSSVDDRSTLVIDPGSRSISGTNTSGPAYHFDSGKFQGKQVYLGELRTDCHGRLLFLGGHGVSASTDGTTATTFANNDGWHDDVSDGSVVAEVLVDGTPISVDPAWVVVAPPNYAPALLSVRTMRDLMFDVFVQSGALPFPARLSFARDIYPIFQRMAGLEWVNAGFAAQFGWGGPNNFPRSDLFSRLANTSPIDEELRRQFANTFRDFEKDDYSPVPWPWLYGDAMNIPPAKTPRQHAALTDTQLLMLQIWARGDFDPDLSALGNQPSSIDGLPLQEQPGMLDRASMEFCLADAFHPGCEMTWPMRHASMYMAPYRIRHRPPGYKEPFYGKELTSAACLAVDGPLYAQAPGDISRWMAVPWQTDTASCRSGYLKKYDPYVPTFWPARVPNQVLAMADYLKVLDPHLSVAERREAFHRRADWFRTLGGGGYQHEINQMISNFGDQGLVEVLPGVPNDPLFPPTMQVESFPKTLAPVTAAAKAVAGMSPAVSTSFAASDKAQRFKRGLPPADRRE